MLLERALYSRCARIVKVRMVARFLVSARLLTRGMVFIVQSQHKLIWDPGVKIKPLSLNLL